MYYRIIKRIAFPFAAIAAGLFVAVVFAELLLRLAGVSYPYFFAYDAERLRWHRSGAEGLYTDEGTAFVRINSHGLRDREHSFNKPPGTIRIAILGDSFAEAFQVELEETFWSTIERDLRTCAAVGKRKIETINFGVSGYGTAAEWLSLQKDVWKYDPDIVLLAFFTGNDLRNNVYTLERSPFTTYFTLREGRLQRDIPAGDAAVQRRGKIRKYYEFLLQYSRLFELVEHVRLGTTIGFDKIIAGSLSFKNNAVGDDLKASATYKTEEGLDEGAYSEPKDTDPAWKQAWEVTEEILKEMNREILSRGKIVFIATLTNGTQDNLDPSQLKDFLYRLDIMY